MNLKKYRYCLLLSCFFSLFATATNTEIHQHQSKEIKEGIAIPKIALRVFRDKMDGVNIHIEVANYVLGAPDLAPQSSLSEQGFLYGHAHLFINGMKQQRLYGNDAHIPQAWLKKGVNQIAISLNSHQHENWLSDKQNIVGSVFIDLNTPALVLHHFTSQPLGTPPPHH